MPDFAGNSRLSPKQEQAILIMLRPSHGSHPKMAKELGIAERTLRTWLSLPHFQQRLKEVRAQIWQESLDTLTSSLREATLVLTELLKSESELIRLRASLGLITVSLKAHEEFTLEERIAVLEAELERRKNNGGYHG